MMSWYWGAGAWGTGVMVVAWMALFATAAWLIARATRTEHTVAVPEPARAALDRRFAAGDLSAEQYAELRRQLSGTSQSP